MPPPAPLRRLLDALPRDQVMLLLDDDGVPWTADRLTRRFREVLDALAGDKPEAGWNRLQLRDLRRTGIVAMAEAGCTVPEITAISGHDADECQRIIETYLPRNAELAKAAVRKWDRKLGKARRDTLG